MNSVTTIKFRKCYSELPAHIQDLAKKSYKLWKEHPRHTSLQFKQIHKTQTIYSVRISLSYRALGVLQNKTMVWFWIGSHAEYDEMISKF